jgi:uncharacterized 2Fe-2S/4Fe-4S cluster protein (DUF4445 family)
MRSRAFQLCRRDIVSGIIASGVHQKQINFFMDIGTNGEIIGSDWMITASVPPDRL